MSDSTLPIDFPSIGGKYVVANFDGGDLSSDAGLLLLAEADRKVGLTAVMAQSVPDSRQAAKVKHTVETLLRERIYGIAAGYEDANDLNSMRHDAALKLSCERTPSQSSLAAQPTISRFENAFEPVSLIALGEAIVRIVIAQLPEATDEVFLDIDATDSPCYGQQEFKGFSGYYDEHCYVPLYLFVTGPDGRQRLLATLLRAGRTGNATGACWLLRKAVAVIRRRFPDVRIIVRADAGFGTAKVMNFCEHNHLHYILALRGNNALHRLSESTQLRAAAKYTAWSKHNLEECREFETFAYQAKTWPRERPVTVKAEVTQGQLCPRYIVASFPGLPKDLYELYCQRGDCENRIKEVKLDLNASRTSCCRFWANQTRLLFHTAASVLICCLQEALTGTISATAQVATIRARFLKVATRIVQSCRRIRLYLPTSYPWQAEWRLIHERLCRT